jgi:cytochrome P450 family 4
LDTFSKYIKDYGELVKIQIGPRHTFLLIADYNLLEYILSSSKLLTKSDDYRYVKPWLGTGLLTSEGKQYHFNKQWQ